MAISGYTDNFNWPMLGDVTQNWGAVFNGILEDLDVEVAAAQNPVVARNGTPVMSFMNGEMVFRRYSTTGG